MQNSFISECVTYLYKKYDREISNVKIVLPSRRASLFFNRELSKQIGQQPIWQPKFYSMDNLFAEHSSIAVAEHLRLLVTLYKVYSIHHQEDFDSFYYWGEMLLSDFEVIDNYMVDARSLFENSADLKDIELQFDYMSPEDAEEIRRFWTHFRETRNSDEKQYFFNIWKTLFPIYNEFKAQLLADKIGYRGMICRMVAEDLLSGELKINETQKYALIGFNALSNTEKVLFDAIQKSGNGEFLWDSDSSYLKNHSSEAGLFIRANRERYGESNDSVLRDNYIKPKEITVVKSPSVSMECKYVWEFLEQCNAKAKAEGRELGAETVIVLTDESLLLPVLYSIPPFVEHFNVTAGYELRLTQLYSLTETLISLQMNCNGRGEEVEFYYRDVEKILSAPLVRAVLSDDELLAASKLEQGIYYKEKDLQIGDFLSIVFRKIVGWESISDYLILLYNRMLIHNETPETKEVLFKSLNTVLVLKDLIKSVELAISDRVYLSLLRKHLKRERISYEGEPLIGIQVMGILESRTLDFENVLLLSVGEENFPSKSMGASFVPSNLRHGYGLPTGTYHQAMYSYYFYRLLQRAKRVDISYVSMGNETSSGEPSRYIYQLIYAPDHNIQQLELSLNLTTSDIGSGVIVKNEKVIAYLNGLKSLKYSLSASSFFNYIECPIRFYYKNIERVGDLEDKREKEFDAADSGNALHYSLEKIYRPLIGLSHQELVKRLSSIENPEEFVNVELEGILGVKRDEFPADIKHNRKTIVHYLSTIIAFDLNRKDDFVLHGVEVKIDEVVNGVRFKGSIDRIDRLPSGAYRIIDYKSGRVEECKELSSLFDSEADRNCKGFMQSLLYSQIIASKESVEVVPSLYYVREMNKKGYSPLLKIGSIGEIRRFSEVREEYEAELKSKMDELFDIEAPFYKCDSEKKCQYCDFSDLCTI